MGINKPVHGKSGQKENANRRNPFGLQERCSFESAILDSLFQNAVFIPRCLSRSSVLNTTLELLILPRSPGQQAEGPGERQAIRARTRGLDAGPGRLSSLPLLPQSAGRSSPASPAPARPRPSHPCRQSLRGLSAVRLPRTTDQPSAGGDTNLLPTARSRSHTVCAPRPVCPRLAPATSQANDRDRIFSNTPHVSLQKLAFQPAARSVPGAEMR